VAFPGQLDDKMREVSYDTGLIQTRTDYYYGDYGDDGVRAQAADGFVWFDHTGEW
jgi:hypothetical protein